MRKLSTKTIIKKRIAELEDIFSTLDDEKLKIVRPTIAQIAQMEVYIDQLVLELEKVGFVEIYVNGKDQTGKKMSSEAQAYSTMVKNYNAAIKTLLGCMPETQRKEAKDALDEFLSGKP